jgi:hypothetical protein
VAASNRATDQSGGDGLRGFLTDSIHALRLYGRTPGASLTAIVMLAIGVAFVGAFLSLYVDLVLRPDPGFERSNRIVTVAATNGRAQMGAPFALVERMNEELSSVEAAAAIRRGNVLLGDEPELVPFEMVSAGFFDGLRPRLALGQGLAPEEHRVDAEPIAVISHRLWQQRFGGRPDVIGSVIDLTRNPDQAYMVRQTIRMGDREISSFTSGAPERETTPFRIVGVMGPDLPGMVQPETSLWIAFERAFPLFVGSAELAQNGQELVFVRLRPGASATTLAGEMATRFADDMPPIYQSLGARIDAIEGIVQDIAVQRGAKRQLRVFLAGSVLLALVAAANLSLFLLARAPGRRRELGIRMAVGARAGRIARQLATEAGVLIAAAAILGLALSIWLAAFLRGLAILRLAEWQNVTLFDWRVLSLTAAVLVMLTVLVSLAPVLGIRRLGISASSRETMARASLAQRLAGTAQIAVAGAIGAAAVAFGWYIGALTFGDPGYAVDDRYVVRFDDGRQRVGTNFEGYRVDMARRREAIEAVPGIEAIAFGNPAPGDELLFGLTAQFPDPNDASQTFTAMVGMLDGHFVDVLGLRVAHGQGAGFGSDASFGNSEALVNQAFARAYWGQDDVVGEYLPSRPGQFWGGAQVVGVLEDLSFGHPAADVEPFIFTSIHSGLGQTAVIESTLTAAQLQQELDALAASGALDVHASNVRSLRAMRNELIAPDRARGLLTLVTASLIVALAGMGYYGTQRYLVAAGRREYAIRSSLGAAPGRLGRLVMQRGLLMSLPGLALGGMLGFIVAASLRDDFVSRDISPSLVTGYVVIALAALLLLATIGPALTASRTQPAPLLREE